MFVPEIVPALRGYTRRQLAADLSAGVIVGIVALPLAIAFAIASGVTPDRGLYTAIVAGFLISALGGSRVQIGGPTGAFVVIVYGIVQKYGVDGLIVATLMAGLILIALGAARMGGAIKFIPHPVVIGFTSGIAVVIFSSQVKDVLGHTEFDDADVADAARQLPRGVVLYGINGPFFFGAAERFKEVLSSVAGKPRVLILRMRHVPAIDSTGLHALRELSRTGRRGGTRLVLADVHAQPMIALVNSGVLDGIGSANVFDSLDGAMARARELVERPKASPVAIPVP